MTPSQFVNNILNPGLEWTSKAVGIPRTREAAVFLTAVAIQETNLKSRFQILESGNPGPARGWWQFESPTIGLLLKHRVSGNRLITACGRAEVSPDNMSIWRAIEGHDNLATCVARLLLLTDPFPIPTTASEGWRCYNERLWRPGKPHHHKWAACWSTAEAHVTN